MMASLKLGARKKSLLLRRETRAEAQSANKIGGKGANIFVFVGISGRRGIAEF